MNIAGLLFGSLKTTGGYQVFAYNLFRHLTLRNHQVTLYVTSNEYQTDPIFYQTLPFFVCPLLPKTKGLAKHLPSIIKYDLRRRQKKHRYDIWQIIGAYPAGFLASTLQGTVPLVLRTHGDDIQADLKLGYGQRLDEKRNKEVQDTLQKMDRLIALTPSVSACYQELQIPTDCIVEIPNGITTDRFHRSTDKTHIRKTIGVPINTPLLLTVSRNHPKKGLNHIPDMACMLKQKGHPFHWLVVGKDVEKLAPLVEEKGVKDCVTLHPEVKSKSKEHLEMPSDELIDIFCCADIFVFPSYLETFGRVLIEAMAAKLAIVTTTAPGCCDVVKHRQTGLQSAPGDQDKMVGHIIELLENKTTQSSLTMAGLEYAKNFDWSIVVEQYESLYQDLT